MQNGKEVSTNPHVLNMVVFVIIGVDDVALEAVESPYLIMRAPIENLVQSAMVTNHVSVEMRGENSRVKEVMR